MEQYKKFLPARASNIITCPILKSSFFQNVELFRQTICLNIEIN